MKTKNLLTLVLTFAFIMSFTGCQKDTEKIQTNPGNGQHIAGLKTAAVGVIVSAGTVVNGVYKGGIPLTSDNSVTLKINVLAVGTYSMATSTVNGYSFAASGSFNSTGTQFVTLPATGTPAATGINTFLVTFGTTCSFAVVVVSNNPIVQSSCNTNYTYYEVANHATQKIWLDRNLGASQVAQSSIDFLSYGCLYQWGRLTDNHQCITWASSYSGTPVNGVTSTTSTKDNPGNALFVKTLKTPFDWRVPQNNNLWQGVSGINNPCPAGFRIPTNAEFTAEVNTWATKNTTGAFGSSLKWAMAGYRDFPDGQLYQTGAVGGYWSSTIANTSKAMILWFSPTQGFTLDDFRAVGYSVRCIKN